jgi:hypothetical protein
MKVVSQGGWEIRLDQVCWQVQETERLQQERVIRVQAYSKKVEEELAKC